MYTSKQEHLVFKSPFYLFSSFKTVKLLNDCITELVKKVCYQTLVLFICFYSMAMLSWLKSINCVDVWVFSLVQGASTLAFILVTRTYKCETIKNMTVPNKTCRFPTSLWFPYSPNLRVLAARLVLAMNSTKIWKHILNVWLPPFSSHLEDFHETSGATYIKAPQACRNVLINTWSN